MKRFYNTPCEANGELDKANNRCVRSGKTRFLSSEVGYHLKFDFGANGLPRGCPAFDDPTKDMKWYTENHGIAKPGTHGCPLQDHPDENGEPIHKAVELYANDGDVWIKDFVLAYDKMQQNGNWGLELGPNIFWRHRTSVGR